MPVDLPPPPRPEPKTSRPGYWLILLLQLLIVAGLVLIWTGSRGHASAELPERARDVASKLKAAGALGEAAGLYERYLDAGAADDRGRAAIAFSLGQLYLEQGRYEKALRWFYEAESLGPGELEEEVGKKIVHALEALGRVHAAKAALARRTQLESAPGVERPESDPLVATIGADEVRRSDVTRALDDLPPFLRQRFATADGMTEFLRKYVADELIFRKAQKMEYDADPEVRRQLEGLLKQLVVGKFVEKEVIAKLEVSESDLKNFLEANRARYDEPETAKLRLIKLASKNQALALKQRIDKGLPFGKAAAEASLHAATKDKGGLLERQVRRGEDFLGDGDPRVIGDVVFRTPKGQVTDPTPAGGSFYLFKTEEIKAGQPVSLDDVRARVQQDYRMDKSQSAYRDLIKQTLSAEDVELFPEKMSEGN